MACRTFLPNPNPVLHAPLARLPWQVESDAVPVLLATATGGTHSPTYPCRGRRASLRSPGRTEKQMTTIAINSWWFVSKRAIRFVLAAIGISLAAGCDRAGQTLSTGNRRGRGGGRALRQYDKNRDGKISGTELDACPALKSALGDLGDGKQDSITAAMIARRIEAWQQSKVARMVVCCRVTRKGQPLTGAEVTLVPEAFLGPALPTGRGTTDASGGAWSASPPAGPRIARHAVRLLSRRDRQAGGQHSRALQCRHDAGRRGRKRETGRRFNASLRSAISDWRGRQP